MLGVTLSHSGVHEYSVVANRKYVAATVLATARSSTATTFVTPY
jgi:hypothetical protein